MILNYVLYVHLYIQDNSEIFADIVSVYLHTLTERLERAFMIIGFCAIMR